MLLFPSFSPLAQQDLGGGHQGERETLAPFGSWLLAALPFFFRFFRQRLSLGVRTARCTGPTGNTRRRGNLFFFGLRNFLVVTDTHALSVPRVSFFTALKSAACATISPRKGRECETPRTRRREGRTVPDDLVALVSVFFSDAICSPSKKKRKVERTTAA